MRSRLVRLCLLPNIQRSGSCPALLERTEYGETVTKLARSLNVSRSLFASLLHQDRNSHELVCQAGQVQAKAFRHEAVEFVNGGNPVRVELTPAKRRDDLRAWCASKCARGPSDTQQPQDPISLGQPHLSAPRVVAHAAASTPRPALAAEVERADESGDGGGP